jgi:hypothetical protein
MCRALSIATILSHSPTQRYSSIDQCKIETLSGGLHLVHFPWFPINLVASYIFLVGQGVDYYSTTTLTSHSASQPLKTRMQNWYMQIGPGTSVFSPLSNAAERQERGARISVLKTSHNPLYKPKFDKGQVFGCQRQWFHWQILNAGIGFFQILIGWHQLMLHMYKYSALEFGPTTVCLIFCSPQLCHCNQIYPSYLNIAF